MKKTLKNTIFFAFALTTLVFFGASKNTFAQGIMNFKEETFDFGNIDEGTQAIHEFEFTNTGNQPIEISKVEASCGCTSPTFTKEAVMPGKKGKIKASFDSNGRPGMFLKSLTVKNNTQKPNLLLYIKGFVKGKKVENNPNPTNVVATPLSAPPAIQMEKNQYDFGRVESGNRSKHRFMIYNSGGQDLVITNLESRCGCVSFGLSNSVIAPQQTEILELTLNADKIQELQDVFTISSNDPQTPKREIILFASIYQNFSKQMFKNKKGALPFEK